MLAQACDEVLHVGWQRSLDAQGLAGHRVHESKCLGVKCLAGERGGEAARCFASVDGITHDRMADLGEMDPDLVGAPGFEAAGEQAAPEAEVFDHLVVRDCRNAVLRAVCDAAAAVAAVGHERPVNRSPGRLDDAVDHGEIRRSMACERNRP